MGLLGDDISSLIAELSEVRRASALARVGDTLSRVPFPQLGRVQRGWPLSRAQARRGPQNLRWEEFQEPRPRLLR